MIMMQRILTGLAVGAALPGLPVAGALAQDGSAGTPVGQAYNVYLSGGEICAIAFPDERLGGGTIRADCMSGYMSGEVARWEDTGDAILITLEDAFIDELHFFADSCTSWTDVGVGETVTEVCWIRPDVTGRTVLSIERTD
tara:strand:- start:18497 stop:18919 length:423 start_codon:yes stop_codon:yes gene_type:complete